jgi:UDP-2,3-diacylglucosamine hydrolase
MRRVFLSDVHLSPREPLRAERLVRFLEREAGRIDELYILGDLFDYWIGPKHLDLPDYRDALEALWRVTRSGVRVFFLHGNRDFYTRGFEAATGVEVPAGRTEHRLALGPTRVYLCHGDYLEGRRGLGFAVQEAIRSRPIEWIWTRLPTGIAGLGARFYRWLSGRKGRRPKTKALHVGPHGLSEDALMAEFRRETDIIVCGHVHVPQEVTFQVDGRERRLFTLGCWSDGESYVEEEDGRWRLCGAAVSGPPETGAKKDSGRTGGHSTTA